MSRFYTETTNQNESAVTAASHKGQNTHTYGRNGGIRIISSRDRDIKGQPDISDMFEVYLTHGKAGDASDTWIGQLLVLNDGSLSWESIGEFSD